MTYLGNVFKGVCFTIGLCACTQAPAEVVFHTPSQGKTSSFSQDILTSPAVAAVSVDKVSVEEVTPLMPVPLAPAVSQHELTPPESQESITIAWAGNLQEPAPLPALKQPTLEAKTQPFMPTPVPSPVSSPTPAPTPAPIPSAQTAALPPAAESIAIGDVLMIGEGTPEVAPSAVAIPMLKPAAGASYPTPVKKHFASKGFIWPVEGKIVSAFGPKPGGKQNDGINIEAAEGTPVLAAADGEVVYAGDELRGYGNLLLLRHEGNWVSAYAHNQSILVNKGDQVQQGDTIAYVGKTGNVATPQLHFALRQGKTIVDPKRHLPTVIGLAH